MMQSPALLRLPAAAALAALLFLPTASAVQLVSVRPSADFPIVQGALMRIDWKDALGSPGRLPTISIMLAPSREGLGFSKELADSITGVTFFEFNVPNDPLLAQFATIRVGDGQGHVDSVEYNFVQTLPSTAVTTTPQTSTPPPTATTPVPSQTTNKPNTQGTQTSPTPGTDTNGSSSSSSNRTSGTNTPTDDPSSGSPSQTGSDSGSSNPDNNSSSPSSNDGGGGGLSTAELAAIGAGIGVFLLALILGFAYLFYRKRKQAASATSSPTPDSDTAPSEWGKPELSNDTAKYELEGRLWAENPPYEMYAPHGVVEVDVQPDTHFSPVSSVATPAGAAVDRRHFSPISSVETTAGARGLVSALSDGDGRSVGPLRWSRSHPWR